MNKNPTNHLVHLTLLQLLYCSRSELNYICCPSHKWLRIHHGLKMEKLEQKIIYDLDVQFPQRLKSTFLRFLLFYSFSTDPLWTKTKSKLPNWIYFSNLNPPWAQQQHWAINIPNTQQGIFKYNFQMLCLLHGFTWPRKTLSQPLMICLAFILFSIYLILRVKWRVNETKI